MLRLLLLAALAAPVARAQTVPLRAVWPLVPGNTWTYVTSEGEQNTPVITSRLSGAATWTALDSADTADGRRPRLRVEYGGTAVDCVVAASVTESVQASHAFRLVDAAGTRPCPLPSAAFPESIDGAPFFEVSGPFVTDVRVGGVTLGRRSIRSGFDDIGLSPRTQVNWRTVDSLGVSGFFYSSGLTNLRWFRGGALRQATVAGRTVGQPLGSRTDFWPLAAGNEWHFRLVDIRDGADIGVVVWTVETAGAGLALRVRHVRDGVVRATATCPLAVSGASPASTWQTTFSLSSCALPQPYLTPSVNGQAVSLQIDTYAPNTSVVAGPQTVTADVATGEGQGRDNFTSYALARDLGPVRYYVSGSAGSWTATLAFARVGARTVGVQVVADEAGPEAAALAFSAGPNPSRGAVALAFALPTTAEVGIAVVDALGRTVQRFALGMRPAGAGAARVDLSDLAPGTYSIRLTAGQVRAAVRVSVVR